MEVFLNLVRTADHLMRDFDELFKPFGLSVTQVNVLHILRYAIATGLPCKAIAQRMITRDPDITRLLDRLEARQLITRERSSKIAAWSPPASPSKASTCSNNSISQCSIATNANSPTCPKPDKHSSSICWNKIPQAGLSSVSSRKPTRCRLLHY